MKRRVPTAGDHGAGLDADPQLPWRKPELLPLPVGVCDELLHLQRRQAGVDRVGPVRLRQAAGAQVGVADRLERLEPGVRDDLVEAREIVVELLDQARRVERFRQPGEVLEIGEQDRRRFVIAGLDAALRRQLVGHRRRQNVPQQPVRALSRRLGRGLGFRHLRQERIPLQELPAQLQLSHGLLRQATQTLALRRD